MPWPKWDFLPGRRLSLPVNRSARTLDPYEDCPLCRHGQLTTLALMDAMSCDYCRHIFSIDLSRPLVQPPTLRLEDSAQPLFWQWTGQRWQATSWAKPADILWLWVLCTAIATIPSALLGLAVYMFPATPGSQGAWIAPTWLGITLGAHVGIALWLLAEHYQWPIYIRLKLTWSRIAL